MMYSQPLTQPLLNSSVYSFKDLETYELAVEAKNAEFIYARDGHPNLVSLCNQLNALENTTDGIVTGSGMGAICATILALCKPGDRILAGKRLYGRTLKVLGTDFTKLGIQLELVDETNGHEIENGLKKPAKLFFLESITNPTCRVPDLGKILSQTKKSGTILVVDNTFATPDMYRPIESGVDLVIESLTKILCGHSDITLGYVGGNSQLIQLIKKIVFDFGFFPSPGDCWLMCRSLETFKLRFDASCQNAITFANWVKKAYPSIRIEFPGLSEHPDHLIANELFQGRFANIMAIEIPGGREGVNKFLRKTPEIPFCPSLGHTHTTVSHSWSTSHRQLDGEQKKALGITEGLLRFSIGIEKSEDLIAHFSKGMKAIS